MTLRRSWRPSRQNECFWTCSFPTPAGLKARLSDEGKILIVSGRDDAATVSLARTIRVAGFMSKVQPLAAIQDNLRIVLEGVSVFPPQSDQPEALALADLSPAQARILAAAATGKLNKQIAFDMALSETTVKSHRSAFIKKLGVANRTQTILMARANGQPEQPPAVQARPGVQLSQDGLAARRSG